MILAMLTQFHRKDFITMTVCALGFYFLTYNESTRRSQFRMLVLLIACSIVQDVLWFVFNRDTEDDDDDGGVERSVKTFSRKVSYLSFAWRVSKPTTVTSKKIRNSINRKSRSVPYDFCFFCCRSYLHWSYGNAP